MHAKSFSRCHPHPSWMLIILFATFWNLRQILQGAPSPRLQICNTQKITPVRGRHPCPFTYSLRVHDFSLTSMDHYLQMSAECLSEGESWKSKSNYASNFNDKRKLHQDKAPQLLFDKLAIKCGSESCPFIHTHEMSRLSTTFHPQVSSKKFLNFYEFRIVTIPGKHSAKSQEQNPESSPKQDHRRECHYKLCRQECRKSQVWRAECESSVAKRMAWWTLNLPQSSRANPVKC